MMHIVSWQVAEEELVMKSMASWQIMRSDLKFVINSWKFIKV